MSRKEEIAARRLVAVGYRRACSDWLWRISAAAASMESEGLDPPKRPRWLTARPIGTEKQTAGEAK